MLSLNEKFCVGVRAQYIFQISMLSLNQKLYVGVRPLKGPEVGPVFQQYAIFVNYNLMQKILQCKCFD